MELNNNLALSRPPKQTWKYTEPKARYRNNNGYIILYMPWHPNAMSSGCILEHRFVMENILGRFLKPEEFVHHKNSIRDDNRPQNLELLTNAENTRRCSIEQDKAKLMRMHRWPK